MLNFILNLFQNLFNQHLRHLVKKVFIYRLPLTKLIHQVLTSINSYSSLLGNPKQTCDKKSVVSYQIY